MSTEEATVNENSEAQELETPAAEAQPAAEPEILEREGADGDSEDATEASAAAEPEAPTEPEDPMAKLKAEVEKWQDAALRGKAELENLRKRMARERTDAIKYGNSALIETLLPVIDNFMMGLEASRQESEQSIVFQGMQMVFKQIEDFLSNQGVEIADAEPGQPFDPKVHEAVSQQPSDEVPDGAILAVVRRGYRLHDRLIRAANVIVSTGVETSQPEATEPETEA
ncbi:MAG: molecular chaperone GrpE [Verrucomicrobiales bacterium]|jgi:molecular chaperone GrpE